MNNEEIIAERVVLTQKNKALRNLSRIYGKKIKELEHQIMIEKEAIRANNAAIERNTTKFIELGKKLTQNQ